MQRFNKIDVLAGLFILVVGVMVIVEALQFDLGSARRMGPGYFPFYVGILLLAIGVGIAFDGSPREPRASRRAVLERLRSPCLLLAAVIIFALFIERFGLFPAVATAVFLACLADPNTTMLHKVALTIAVPIVCVVLFKFGLSMQVDIVRWRP